MSGSNRRLTRLVLDSGVYFNTPCLLQSHVDVIVDSLSFSSVTPVCLTELSKSLELGGFCCSI